MHEVPFHDLKVGVWCEISAGRIIGPVFLMKQYMLDVIWDWLSSFFEQHTDEEKLYRHFMQDNATTNTEKILSMH